MIRRVDPRRPALITPQGLRRIVLGGTEGERGLRLAAVSHATARRPRLATPSERAAGCLLVLVHPDSGSLDEHAREAIAAAALLARPDEAVVVLMPWPQAPGTPGAPDPQAGALDAAALGIDRLELLPVNEALSPEALAEAVAARWQTLSPRLTLAPDRGDDGDLGRRLAVRQPLACAAGVVEIADGRVRVRGPAAR